MKKILVFGGAGFLGHYLVKELLLRKYKVVIADIKQDKDLGDKVNYIYCDIESQKNIDDCFKNDKFDVVYNLAGFANLNDSVKNPLKTMGLNVISNIYILDACVKYKIKKFVYASSAYAMSTKGSFYGISKLASEKIIEEYHQKYSLNFTVLRYGSVYSERSYKNNYLYNLVEKAVLEKHILHNGDGNEVREYIHAGDAARLSVDVIETCSFDNTHAILTGNDRLKRSEIFEMINEILDDEVEIKYSDNPDVENHYKFTPYSFSPSLSRKLIANPHIDIGQGLLACIRSIGES